jgi:hypothetical protein
MFGRGKVYYPNYIVITSVKAALLVTCFHAGYLLGSFFDPEDGSDMFLRNFG